MQGPQLRAGLSGLDSEASPSEAAMDTQLGASLSHELALVDTVTYTVTSVPQRPWVWSRVVKPQTPQGPQKSPPFLKYRERDLRKRKKGGC